SIACGVPPPSATGSSRKRARPSRSVNRVTFINVIRLARYLLRDGRILTTYRQEPPDEFAQEVSVGPSSHCGRRWRPVRLRSRRQRRRARRLVEQQLALLAVGLGLLVGLEQLAVELRLHVGLRLREQPVQPELQLPDV